MSKSVTFEKFEHDVMQKILEENTSINRVLLEQYRNAQVINRKFTGAGFFTYFKVPEDVLRLGESVEYGYGDVICDLNGIEEFGGFVLFVENGVIKCLEGYTFMDGWPDSLTNYKLYHNRSK